MILRFVLHAFVVSALKLTLATSKLTENQSLTGNETERTPSNGYRIFKGVIAEDHAYPWQVQIHKPEKNGIPELGGGTIICPRYIMTAYHCVAYRTGKKAGRLLTKKDQKRILVYVGTNRLSQGKRYKVGRAIKHPNAYWEPPPEDKKLPQTSKLLFDYAILELTRPIRTSPGPRPDTMPIYLPEKHDLNKIHTGTKFAASGWGLTENSNNTPPNKLHVVTLEQLPPYGQPGGCPEPPAAIRDELCLGHDGKGICGGDSGGPLAWIDLKTSKKEVKLIAVASKAKKCNVHGYRSFFSPVPLVVGWINKVTGSCNRNVCRKSLCMTQNKLKPQAMAMLGG